MARRRSPHAAIAVCGLRAPLSTRCVGRCDERRMQLALAQKESAARRS